MSRSLSASDELLKQFEEQHRQSVLWSREHGLGGRVSVGCPYDPTRPEPDNRIYICSINAAGDLVYTLDDADAYEREMVEVYRRKAAQRETQRDA